MNFKNNNIIIILCLLLSFTGFGQEAFYSKIESIFKAEFQKENISSAYLQVFSESKNIDFQFAESKNSLEDSASINQPFYTASITKFLTAIAIGILQEHDKLDFEDNIGKYLSEEIMEGLHIFENHDYSKDISIAHLLQHRSGLPDYFTDETLDKSPNIINQILLNKDKFWLPMELIQFTKDHMKPHFAPGDGFYYSDTGYVLLALIIENVSGLSLDEFFKEFIFMPLNMNSSYINLRSVPLDGKLPMSEFYAGEYEVSGFKSLSADWGGGGLISTTQDLFSILKAYNEDIILKKETRLKMQNWVYESQGMTYGFGIRKVSFKELFDEDSSLEIIGHTGSTGSFLWYCPQLDTYISGTLNQLEASKNALKLVYSTLNVIDNPQ
jgi:CubicO group peptidase (beta-lactamase class C family)